MKIFLCYILLGIPLMFSAQTSNYNYASLDRKVIFIQETNLDSLSEKLSRLGATDREKVRIIFRWITEHIKYNVRIYNRNRSNPGNFYEEDDDTSAVLPPLNERVAAKVLKRKTAFCDGYSRLFSALCEKNGIRSEVIHGFARTNMGNQGRFGVNHSWNAVFIDSAWFLLDVTWASGFISYGNDFIKQYNDYYFLTDPKDFIKDHYPDDVAWTLLDQPPLYREFNQRPYRHSGYNKIAITTYTPQKGIIEVTAGDTVRFELRSGKEIRNLFVSSSFTPDSLLLLNPPGFIINNEELKLSYTITGNEGDWLYLFCNDEAVLRYKLNFKK